LPSVWQAVEALRPRCPTHPRRERRIQGGQRTDPVFHWVTDIEYHDHRLQWLECLETVTSCTRAEHTNRHFVHLTNLEVTAQTVCVLSATGRLRWTIENEGCNTQKNLGYALQHEYARMNWQGDWFSLVVVTSQ